jgi:PAS domain S-box-containing protein
LDPSFRLGADRDSSFQILWEEGDRIFCRGWRRGADGSREAVLTVLPAAEHPTPASLDRLAHGYALKNELDSAWAARPLALVREHGRTMLLLEDPGGEPLARQLGTPMQAEAFLSLAIGIGVALGKLHRRGLVHKDVKPGKILVDCTDGQVRLTGFGLASRLSRERQAPDPPEFITGTLAYMAPEQTGRMNRSIDSRSDLYSLGVVLYQMLTGALPFTAADPMEWVHCHVARRPVPPAERVPGVPAVLSAIIMKLLAKASEDRYQTAVGLEDDLRRCLAAWQAQGAIDDFPLGANDTPDRLFIPERLYGREREIATLLAAFERVVNGGAPELVLVSGYSGIGKSSVVNELHKVLVPPRGLFASGKFDQYKRDIPYSTLAQAFQSLVRSHLGKSDTELSGWRDALLEALGPNGRLMVDIIPELTLIIGDQPPVPELSPQDAQRRFQLVFRRFIGVFARPDHPLALFLDDLQWLDEATLAVLEDLLIRSDLQHLMVIGAYRENEVSAAHPLMRTLDAIRSAGGKVAEITLLPLTRPYLRQFIADALRCEPERAAPLAQLVHDKTGGNPFFATQFMSSLAEEGMLTFDYDAARWSWDLEGIRAKGYTDNIVDLMVGRLTRLPAETQTALQLLACLGNVAEVNTLSLVLGIAEEQVQAALWPAAGQELVERMAGGYRFVHDRVQEAAYTLIPEEQRGQEHLRIGRLLVAHISPAKREAAIFDIVNHLNRGAMLITEQGEREQLAELNLVAGKRAKASTAYTAALSYLIAGAALLTDDARERRRDLACELELHRAECEFLTGALAEAELRLATLSTRVATTVDLATVACLRADLYTTLDQSSRAVAVGLDYLRHLGIDWSPHPTEAEAAREYDRIWSQLGSRMIEDLIELPLMSDPASLATLDVLTKLGPPAFHTDANLFSLVICRAVNLSLEGGNCDGSCFAYVRLGHVAGSRFGDYQAGFRFGRLGYDLVEQYGLTRFQARTYMCFGTFVLPWTRHVRAARDLLRRALQVADQKGDLTYVAYSGDHLITNFLAAGDPLADAQPEAETVLAFARKARFGFVIDIAASQLGLIRTLRGRTPTFGSFDDGQFDEFRIEYRFTRNPDLAHAATWYWIRKLQARFFAGEYAEAVEASSRAQSLLWTLAGHFETAEYHFYVALSRAAISASAPAGERRQHIEALAAHHRQLQAWAESCPDNFENRAALVGAEIARIEGRDLDAMNLFEQAIRSSQANGFIHNEAIANELAARHYAACGFRQIADLYLRNARDGYMRWGADGKVRQLDALYPHITKGQRTPGSAGTIGAPVENLDLATVIKVSQAVSGEIVLEKLLDTLMRTAIEYAGAERGLLILSGGAEQRAVAEATITGDTVSVQLRDEPLSAASLPASIVHYVARSHESVILDDASAENPFSRDPYIRHSHARSILCLPLINEARLTGQLYLENSLTPRVFTPSRIAVLKLLASQAAISVENARLHTELIIENRDRQQAEDALRASEERWRSLFENVPVGVMLIGQEGRYVAVNRAFQTMIGYSEMELCGLSPSEITHEDDRAATKAIMAARAAGNLKTQRREKRYRRKDGGVIWADVSSFQVPVARGTLLQAVFAADITHRKQAEEALRRSEAYLAQAQQISQTGSWYWNVQSGEVRWSAEHYRIFGYNPAATKPSLALFTERIHPEDKPALEQTIATSVAERSGFQREYRVVLPDGSVKHLLSMGRPGTTESGALEYVGTVMDITQRKRAEAEARDGEQRFRDVQMELAHANRLATMGQLTASIAHEVNQPIAATVTNAHAALRWLARRPPDLEEVRQTLDRILRDGYRAGEVTSRIRSLVRKEPARKDAVAINESIREVIELARSEVLKNGIAVQMQLADGLPLIQGDRVQLQQVVLNLIVNAIEAMSAAGEGTRELAIATRTAGSDGVLVAIGDSGPGLAASALQHLFDAFYTTKPGGLGMGLSISRSIIEAHGGRLWAETNQPHGSLFQFTMPGCVGGTSRSGADVSMFDTNPPEH